MKKVGIIVGIIGLAVIGVGIYIGLNQDNSIGIIGGSTIQIL